MRSLGRGLHVGIEVIVAILFLFPVYWIIVTATNLPDSTYRIPPVMIPHFDFQPMLSAWTSFPWTRYIANSGGMTAFTIVFDVATSALAGYALAEGRFRGRDVLMLILLAGAMIPEQALFVPRYLVVHSLGLLNTYLAEVLPLLFNSFAIFLYRQFFMTLPTAYRDAARIDGCGDFRYLCYVAFPLARGITYTVMLLVAIATWNQFQWPLIVTTSRAIQPIEVVLAHFSQTYESDWRRMASAVLISVTPLLVLFLAARNQIMQAVAGDVEGGIIG